MPHPASATGVTGRIGRRLARLPLRTRLIAVVTSLVAVAITLVTAATAYLVNQDLMGRLDQELKDAAVPVATEVLSMGSDDQLPTAYAVVLMPTGGTPVQRTHPTGVRARPAIPPLSATDPRVVTKRPFTVQSDIGDYQWRVVAGLLPDNRGTYAVAAPLEPAQQTVHKLVLFSVLVGLLSIVACGAIGWYAVRRVFRPLGQIEDTAAAIAEGDLTRRIPQPTTHDEVASLSRSLNTMLAHIEASFAVREASEERMRQFVSDASHELRTPLATVRGYAELYRQGAVRGEDEVASAMSRIEGEATRMNGLVADLLTLARLDEEPTVTMRPVDLLELAIDATKDARARAPQRAISLVALGARLGPSVVLGAENQLRQVLANLIANALSHTPEGTPVEVAVGIVDAGTGTERAVVEVRDHGPGIDPAAARKVFERFYRADRARSRASGGSGLGLAIVAAIVAGHHGRIGVAQTAGGGATFVVQLPSGVSQASDTTL